MQGSGRIDGLRAGLVGGGAAHAGIHHDEFDDRDVSLIRHRVQGGGKARRMVESHSMLAQPGQFSLVGLLIHRLSRDPAHQALRGDATQRGGQRDGIDAQVDHPRHRHRRVVGVERCQHEVARDRRLDSDLSRLGIPDFANQDDVRVLPQHGPQRPREVHMAVDIDLADPGHLILHRVLDGDDVAAGIIEFVDDGVKRGGLAGAGRAGHQKQAVGLFHDPLDAVAHGHGHLDVDQPARRVDLIQQTADGELPRDVGRDGHAHIQPPVRKAQAHAAVQRALAVPCGKLGARTDLVIHHTGGMARQNEAVHQPARQAEAHPALALLLLEVNVRHPLPCRFMEQVVEE